MKRVAASPRSPPTGADPDPGVLQPELIIRAHQVVAEVMVACPDCDAMTSSSLRGAIRDARTLGVRMGVHLHRYGH